MTVFYYKKQFKKEELIQNLKNAALKNNKLNDASPVFLDFFNNPDNFSLKTVYHQALSLYCSASTDVLCKVKATTIYNSGYDIRYSEDNENLQLKPNYKETTYETERTVTLFTDAYYFISSPCNSASNISNYKKCVLDENDFYSFNLYPEEELYHPVTFTPALLNKFASECVKYNVSELKEKLYKDEKLLSHKKKSAEILNYDIDTYNTYIYATYELSFKYNDKHYVFSSLYDGSFSKVNFFEADGRKVLSNFRDFERKSDEYLSDARKNRTVAFISLFFISIVTIFSLYRIGWYICQETSPQTHHAIIDYILFLGILPSLASAIGGIVFCISKIKSNTEDISTLNRQMLDAKRAVLSNEIYNESPLFAMREPIFLSTFGLSVLPIIYTVLSFFLEK